MIDLLDVFNEEQMMYAIAGPDIVELLEPGLPKKEIQDLLLRIVKMTGLTGPLIMVNIALLETQTNH